MLGISLKSYFGVVLCGLIGAICYATPAIARVSVDKAGKTFRLDGRDTTYVLGVDAKNNLQAMYWGGRLGDSEALNVRVADELSSFDVAASITPQEFPGQGAGLTTEPGLKLFFPDGNRDAQLKFVSYRIAGETLTIELADISRPIGVTLHYVIDPDTGIIGRSSTVHNRGKTNVRIDQFNAAVLTLPPESDYRLYHLGGRHNAEFKLQSQAVTDASTVLESRRGSTSHQNNPWIAIDRSSTTEENGDVWYGALAWSGSWRITVGTDILGRLKITAGYNPFDFSWNLRPGESLDSPIFYAGYTDRGMGDASRRLHRFERAQILPQAPAPKPRPVLYNSWEATYFEVNERNQMALAEKAAKIGAELFVMDDGWFGARGVGKAGLGDWTPNRDKFPHGLKPLIDKVHALGMTFGLWVEPESVNPDSDLYRAHPDWVMNFPGRPRTEGRSQLVLNLARDDVRDHVLRVLDNLLKQNDIQVLKWDYNRNWSEPGWPEVAPEDQQRIYVRYVENLYFILSELRRRHPGLEIENCSGGGGRSDLGMMRYTDQVWTSDTTDPFDRLWIQDGYTHAYTPGTMVAWVTDASRPASLQYRFLSAMQGVLGIGANLDKWTDADVATARNMVSGYKRVRRTIQDGDLYRLIPPTAENSTVATLYVTRDRAQAVLFQMLHSSLQSDNDPLINLCGLDADRIYRVSMIDGTALPDNVPSRASGAYWMRHGVRAPLRGDYQGAGFVFEASTPK